MAGTVGSNRHLVELAEGAPTAKDRPIGCDPVSSSYGVDDVPHRPFQHLREGCDEIDLGVAGLRDQPRLVASNEVREFLDPAVSVDACKIDHLGESSSVRELSSGVHSACRKRVGS